jgi:hypothetical protein
MHEVFRDIDSAKVGLINGILEDAGIPTLVKNFTGGSNITEIPIPTLYPAIYVLIASKVDEAKDFIREFFAAKPESAGDWSCSECGAPVEGFLSECWACQAPKDDR